MRLLHHLETGKAGLYSLGGADSASFVDNGHYPIMNRSPLSWHFEIEFLGEPLLNVQHELDIQNDLGEHIGIAAKLSLSISPRGIGLSVIQ